MELKFKKKKKRFNSNLHRAKNFTPLCFQIGNTQVPTEKKKAGWGEPSLVAQLVKNLPAMQETQVQSLGGEDSRERGMATHSSILA